jgi:hypothetical protein
MITDCGKNQTGSPNEYREIYKSAATNGPSLPLNFTGLNEPQNGEEIKRTRERLTSPRFTKAVKSALQQTAAAAKASCVTSPTTGKSQAVAA